MLLCLLAKVTLATTCAKYLVMVLTLRDCFLPANGTRYQSLDCALQYTFPQSSKIHTYTCDLPEPDLGVRKRGTV